MPKRKTLVRKLDNLTSQIIRARNPKCVICGSREKLGNGHLFSRTNYSLRWDLREDGNCQTSCWPCNFRHERDPFPYTSWYIDMFGIERYNQLHSEWDKITKLSDGDIKEKIEEYKKILSSLDKSY